MLCGAEVSYSADRGIVFANTMRLRLEFIFDLSCRWKSAGTVPVDFHLQDKMCHICIQKYCTAQDCSLFIDL